MVAATVIVEAGAARELRSEQKSNSVLRELVFSFGQPRDLLVALRSRTV